MPIGTSCGAGAAGTPRGDLRRRRAGGCCSWSGPATAGARSWSAAAGAATSCRRAGAGALRDRFLPQHAEQDAPLLAPRRAAALLRGGGRASSSSWSRRRASSSRPRTAPARCATACSRLAGARGVEIRFGAGRRGSSAAEAGRRLVGPVARGETGSCRGRDRGDRRDCPCRAPAATALGFEMVRAPRPHDPCDLPRPDAADRRAAARTPLAGVSLEVTIPRRARQVSRRAAASSSPTAATAARRCWTLSHLAVRSRWPADRSSSCSDGRPWTRRVGPPLREGTGSVARPSAAHLPDRLADALLAEAGVDPGRPLPQLRREERRAPGRRCSPAIRSPGRGTRDIERPR